MLMLWQGFCAFVARRWAKLLRSSVFAALIVVDMFAVPIGVSCQNPGDCHPIGTDMTLPDPQGFMQALPPDLCTYNDKDGNDMLILDLLTPNLSIPSNGYLKAGHSIRVDTEAHTTGTCSHYFFDYLHWVCYYSPPDEIQPLHKVNLDVVPPPLTTSSSYLEFGASYPSRSLDTRNGQGYTSALTYIGEYQFRFQSAAYATACSNEMSSSIVTKSVNVLECGPRFIVNSNGASIHLPPTTIKVYVPDTQTFNRALLWNPLIDTGPLKNAVTDWNLQLSGTNLTLQLTTNQAECSGNTCIMLDQGELVSATGCAQTEQPDSNDVLIGPTVIRLSIGQGFVPNWQGFDATALEHTLKHEIGHALGVHHPKRGTNCETVTDGVMLEGMLPNCYAPVTPTYNMLKINDTLPARKIALGQATQVKCGF